jgi:superfamily II DNA helicase RecQ
MVGINKGELQFVLHYQVPDKIRFMRSMYSNEIREVRD